MSRVRCLAISANDVYLAIWLDTGTLYLISLSTRTIKEIKPKPPPGSAVHCLSFSANEDQLTITIRFGDKVQTYNYSMLNGSVSHHLTFGLPMVCQTCLYSMLFPNFYFTILMNSYSTKMMIRASLRAFIARQKSYLALPFGRIVASLCYTTVAVRYLFNGTRR